MPQGKKTGYLQQDFRLFYNRDRQKRTFSPHYHDFHKLMILLNGNVTYCIEGRHYELLPSDVILVPGGLIHYPVIHDESLYERIIIYLSDDFFTKADEMGGSLKECFTKSREDNSFLIRPGEEAAASLLALSKLLIRASADTGRGAEVIRRCRTLELLVLLNRLLDDRPGQVLSEPSHANPVIARVLSYLNANLTDEELSIDTAAAAVSLDRSYLMHLFKSATGNTIGKYVTEKRLFMARAFLEQGLSVTEACYKSGFKNYAAFYYAYRKKYASSPQSRHVVQQQVEGE